MTPVRSNEINLAFSGWRDWYPVLNQNGTIASTITVARYMLLGRTCFYSAILQVVGTGSAGSIISIRNFPYPALLNNMVIGSFWYLRNTVQYYSGAVTWYSAGQGAALVDTGYLGNVTSFAVVSPNIVTIGGAYEVGAI